MSAAFSPQELKNLSHQDLVTLCMTEISRVEGREMEQKAIDALVKKSKSELAALYETQIQFPSWKD
jgi:hypothetical protein